MTTSHSKTKQKSSGSGFGFGLPSFRFGGTKQDEGDSSMAVDTMTTSQSKSKQKSSGSGFGFRFGGPKQDHHRNKK